MAASEERPDRAPRQHGAMEGSVAPADLDAVRRYRLARVREALVARDYAAIVLFDQMNTRYATDVTDMQLWCMHNENRYAFVPAEGPVVLFEYAGMTHLSEGVPVVDEVRPANPWYYFAAGGRLHEKAQAWAAEIADLVHAYGAGNRRVAIDRTGSVGLHELARHGIELFDGFEVMERAREVKSPGEITLMGEAIRACETGMQAMRDAMEPGMTENALWAKLHETNVRLGGEWIETRLLSSGPRTNPWFREASMRIIEPGDIVAFDTDLVGPYGYCADLSRTWVCGDGRASDEQRRLHAIAAEQIRYNTERVRPGTSLRELSERAWPLPDEFVANRYSCSVHGVGMCDEAPMIKHPIDWESGGYDGMLEPGMVVCVESYIGAAGGREGVKLEEQVLVTEDGHEVLSSFPLELERDRDPG